MEAGERIVRIIGQAFLVAAFSVLQRPQTLVDAADFIHKEGVIIKSRPVAEFLLDPFKILDGAQRFLLLLVVEKELRRLSGCDGGGE